ncbi:GHKL domain-containing protein [Fulvivirga sp. M361]|uniref:ATP-binding protein n=1 Tax=Fulvivirga sp. M361 TaxID=2594266 RepID=UPI00117B40E9|nr:ATP-binding protein [Fulvivirga sp. M361]TRX60601.1 GHKL domain-containing protein [Fulvivirga sp. M361]
MNFSRQSSRHEAIITKYFSDPEREIQLKAGEVLLEQYEINNKLFYVAEGKICGYLPDKHLQEPVFEALDSSFVGVYSFFSEDRKSYSKVVAEEDSVIRYFDDNPFDLPPADTEELLTFLFNVVVGELRSRQHFAGNMAYERQATLQKLIQTEKLATLGQMAAGLAHELNNAIGSLSGNLRQLEEDISKDLVEGEHQQLADLFTKGLQEGQQLSSLDVRKARSKWEKTYALDKATIKKLTKSGIDPDEIAGDTVKALKAASLWNLGYLLHDMKTAATHATHVIQSVKSMGIANQSWSKEVKVNNTIEDALAIIRSLTKQVTLQRQLENELPDITACSGELVQVWINLVKNAVESLINNKVSRPTVQISTTQTADQIVIAIEDNGPGVPGELREKIFQPSFTTKVDGLSFGLGLGLTIVKRIISEHEGDITLFSEPGKTRFTVYLPKNV